MGEAAWLVLPIIILIIAVLGGIYGEGLFTPVEAGAVGAAGAGIDHRHHQTSAHLAKTVESAPGNGPHDGLCVCF